VTAEAPAGRTGDSGSEVEAPKPTAEHLSTAMQLISRHSTHGAGARVDFAEAIAHALAAAAEERLAAVLALHVRDEGPSVRVDGPSCRLDRQPWPCATARAAGAS